MLESIKPCFLKKDAYRHAKERNLPLDFLAPLTDAELLNLSEVQLRVLRTSQKRIIESKKTHTGSRKRGTICLKF